MAQKNKRNEVNTAPEPGVKDNELSNATGLETDTPQDTQNELEQLLYARHAEINTKEDLEFQRGTPIPALFNQFYKFIQNPSTVSVETYKRMVDTDDTIGSGVDFLVTCLAARLGDYIHPNQDITEFVNKALGKIKGGWKESCKDMLSATWTGFGVQEKVWKNDDMGFIVKKLIQLPPSTILFETDREGELTPDGILQYQRNYNPHLLGQGLGYFGSNLGFSYDVTAGGARPDGYAKMGDFPYPIRTANSYNYLSIRIPTQKCIHYAFNAQGKFGNPYGRSLLRRAYKFYVMKDAFLKMMTVALDRKGTPLTVVFADPNSTLLDGKQYNPNNPASSQKRMRADMAAKEAFKNVHNDSTIILPGKKGQMFDLDFMPQSANTDSFIQALDFCNKSILRALMIPALIFSSGDGTGSYALGQEHARTFDKILDGHLVGFKEAILNQLVAELIAYNFPESVWKKDGLGDFSKRDLTKDEIDKEMEVFEKGINTGIIDTNDLQDLNKMRETIGFDKKTEDEFEEEFQDEDKENEESLFSDNDEESESSEEQSGE